MVDTHKLASETVGRGNGWQVNECRDAPIGEPGKPVDQFLVLGDCIVTRRLISSTPLSENGAVNLTVVCFVRVFILHIPGKDGSLRSQSDAALSKSKSRIWGSWRVESL